MRMVLVSSSMTTSQPRFACFASVHLRLTGGCPKSQFAEIMLLRDHEETGMRAITALLKAFLPTFKECDRQNKEVSNARLECQSHKTNFILQSVEDGFIISKPLAERRWHRIKYQPSPASSYL